MTLLVNQLPSLLRGEALREDEAFQLFQYILGEDPSPVALTAFLVALSAKGITADEITGAARALRQRVTPCPAPAGTLDTCGTGGDGLHTFNISTAAAFIVAACGVPVAKHGNRAVTSASGSADVLEALGIRLELSPTDVAACIRYTGFGFLHAPAHHLAMKKVAPVRRELKIPTLFNLLGPLANPASAAYQLVGVYEARWLEPMAIALQRLGVTAAWVVHGHDGLDEISITTKTSAIAVTADSLRPFTIDPAALGLRLARLEDIRGGDAQTNAAALNNMLEGQPSAYRDCACLNAAACLMIAGKARQLEDGLIMAAQAIDSGAALAVLANVQTFTTSVSP